MYHTQKGFTLIELLVVVLIIGILTSVALPQYQKAVEKSRLVQRIVTVSALYNALEMYRLANGEYPPAKNNTPGTVDVSYFNDFLDIDIPSGKVNYYPGMFISQRPIEMNWGINGGPGNGILICSSHPAYSDYEFFKKVCLATCSDKQWRTWAHGEYCIL